MRNNSFMFILRLFLLTALLLSSAALAQTLRIGAVLSQSGAASSIGNAQATALYTLETQLRNRGSFGGMRVDIIMADDSSTPQQAAREATRLIQEGVHALICCTTEAATKAVSSVAASADILMLSPTTIPEMLGEQPPYWLFGLEPSMRTSIRRVVLSIAQQGGNTLALMTLTGELGDNVQETLEMFLVEGGLRLVAAERYRSNVQVLTPEALWIATRQPGGVLVWGEFWDMRLAVEALRKRGFEGAVYVNPELLELATINLRTFEGAYFPVSPAAVGYHLPRTSPTYDETRHYQSLTARFRFGKHQAQAAYVWDAVMLLSAAFEQTLIYGIDPNNTEAQRQALRDALVGLGPFRGASGIFDFEENRHVGITADSLVIGEMRGGELLPAIFE